MNSGLLIINLGTPSSPTRAAVSHYLAKFLMDKRVIDIPWIVRYLLIHGFIIPFRSKKSAHAYQQIWSERGSPLSYNSLELANKLQQKLKEEYSVALAMRYSMPSIEEGLERLKECQHITILPLYPQYSSAATGSVLEYVFKIIQQWTNIPSLKIINHFYQYPAYIHAQASLIKQHLQANHYLLFSYHGIPERQIMKAGCVNICSSACTMTQNSMCYKAQCYHSSTLLAQALNLSPNNYSTAFQSRLGKTPWIKPYTDDTLRQLREQDIKNITIVCPSFVADCLETLEEIKLQARVLWQQLGGNEFYLIPSMNSDPIWVDAIAQIL